MGLSLVPITLFQSTPSAWRVTLQGGIIHIDVAISIHTLRMEGDLGFRYTVRISFVDFNPHPPHGG